MDILLLILAVILLVIGILGSVLPVLPGPGAAWFSLLLLHWTDYAQFTIRFLVITAFLAVLTISLDYMIPSWGARRYGGSKWGEWGAFIGVFAGLLFGLAGIVLGPLVGALLGELLHNPVNFSGAFRAAWGSFLGFLAGTGIKLLLCLVYAWYFVSALI